MSREVPFDKSEKCDICGKEGAFDFMGDFICGECFKTNEEVMKTAEELYNKILDDDEFKSFPDGLMCMGQFKKALTEYRQSIIDLIDEKLIEVAGWKKLDSDSVAIFDRGYKTALTELKQKIEQLDKESE